MRTFHLMFISCRCCFCQGDRWGRIPMLVLALRREEAFEKLVSHH